jgi:hypothetical protein
MTSDPETLDPLIPAAAGPFPGPLLAIHWGESLGIMYPYLGCTEHALCRRISACNAWINGYIGVFPSNGKKAHNYSRGTIGPMPLVL